MLDKKKKTPVTYELIEPLIVHAEAEGTQMFCEFALPGSDEVVESKARIGRLNTTKSRVMRTMKRTATNQMRRHASRMLRGALGSGLVGRVATQTFNTASRGTAMTTGGSSKEEQQAAILEAFKKVSDHFNYNEETGQWEKPPHPPGPRVLSPVEKQLQENPITAGYDQQILARIMAELAYADGNISPEEQQFFKSMIPESIGTIEKLIQGDPVSRIEAEEVTEGAKSSIFMFAWVISLIDMDLDETEEELLMEYGELFGFDADRTEELIKMAKYYVLEQTIDIDISRQELFDLADKISLDHADAERCKIGMIKRAG